MKSNILLSFIISFIMIVGISMDVSARDPLPPDRHISKITGDLYKIQDQFHNSIFMVTSEGIILADPINNEAAKWIKSELDKRYPDLPVKYVIYSHHHEDHANGGSVFEETATFVGHENMIKNLKLDPANVRVPDVTYTGTKTITLGGKTVELHSTGINHSDDMTVLRFPAERVLYLVDFAAVKGVSYRTLPGWTSFPAWIASLKDIEKLDFDILATGHGNPGIKADIADFRGYVEALYAHVFEGIKNGKSVAEMQASHPTLDVYQDWVNYDAWIWQNIAGAYEIIKANQK